MLLKYQKTKELYTLDFCHIGLCDFAVTKTHS